MNESLLRDLHNEQAVELAEIKTAIKELANLQVVTPDDIADIKVKIANINCSVLDTAEARSHFALFDEAIKNCVAKLENQSHNLQKIENLCTVIGNMKSNDSGEIAQGVEAIKEA